jgi:hypothetical protein
MKAKAVQFADTTECIDTTDTNGTDGHGGDGEIKQHFLDLFTAMSVAAGVPVPATLLEAFAAETASFVADYGAFESDEQGYREQLQQLEQAVARQSIPLRSPRLTVIDGDKGG